MEIVWKGRFYVQKVNLVSATRDMIVALSLSGAWQTSLISKIAWSHLLAMTILPISIWCWTLIQFNKLKNKKGAVALSEANKKTKDGDRQ